MDAGGIYLDNQPHPVVHRDGHRLGTAHAAQPGAEHGPPSQGAVKVRAGDGCKRLVGTLQDALAADIDP